MRIWGMYCTNMQCLRSKLVHSVLCIAMFWSNDQFIPKKALIKIILLSLITYSHSFWVQLCSSRENQHKQLMCVGITPSMFVCNSAPSSLVDTMFTLQHLADSPIPWHRVQSLPPCQCQLTQCQEVEHSPWSTASVLPSSHCSRDLGFQCGVVQVTPTHKIIYIGFL